MKTRRPRWSVRWALILGLGMLVSGCPDPCDGAALQSRLERAVEGDVVELGSCSYTGSFVLPAGVTLRGAGHDRTTLRSSPGSSIALSIESSTREPATMVENLAIASSGCAAAVVRGQGAALLHNVHVRAERGIGLGVEGTERVSLEHVSVEGPLSDGSLPDIVPLPPYTCDSANPATHGIVMIDVPNARLRDVQSRGFAAFGALFVRTELDWEGGAVNDHVGTGLEVYGGHARLSHIEICRSRQATAPIESFNALLAGGAEVESDGLVICEGDAFGIMHDHAIAHHTDLVARDNGFAGVWVQDAESFSLRGARSELTGNGFAGISALRVANFEVDGASIRDTALGTSIMGIGRIEAADGVHLVQNGNVALSNLRLAHNERIGLLLDLGGGSTATTTLSGIVAEGVGDQLGALAQNGTVITGWDTEVSRVGSPILNDAAFSGSLDIAGILGPSCLPDTDAVATEGLAGLIR